MIDTLTLQQTLPDIFIFFGGTIFLAMVLMQYIDWSCIFNAFNCPKKNHSRVPFLYGEATGPEFWKCKYPESRGVQQSPININSQDVCCMNTAQPLCWFGYGDEPATMTIANDGNTVEVFGYWPCPTRPMLRGGPLRCAYEFHSALFRWGPGDDEGSEHTLDYERYPMELQVVHVKRGAGSFQDITACRIKDGILIMSYFFQVTSNDNPYLDHVVQNLRRVRCPGAFVQIPAFPLEWLCPKFESKYYHYQGSISHPPCSEIVVWLINPEPIAISASQRLIGGARRDGTPGLSDASRAAVIATRGAMHAAHAASATRMLSGCVAATAHFAAQAGRRDGAEDLRRGQKAE
uniref:Alpha-carbonic anhydrase domain-containing protein n=1 Tax=Trichogramma kaykai TaxID=54128 RepID=A0ABD2WS60_9HYME